MRWMRLGKGNRNITDVTAAETVVELEQPKAGHRPMSWMRMTLLMTNLGLVALVVWSWFQFGSIGIALGYLKGERLFPDSYAKSFGAVNQGEIATVTFSLTNLSDAPITILGARSSCTCVLPPDIPIRVPPSKTIAFRAQVHTQGKRGSIAESILLYTCEVRPRSRSFSLTKRRDVTLRVKGFVRVASIADRTALE